MCKIKKSVLWIDELESKFSSGIAWMFMLYLNVMDYVKSAEGYKRLVRYLIENKLKSRQMIVFYNRSKGITFEKPELEDKFIKLLGLLPLPGQKKVVLPKDPSIALPLLEKFLKISSGKAHAIDKDFNETQPFGALILGFGETLAPNGNISSQNDGDRTNIITLARWGREEAIYDAGNIIIMLTQNKEEVAPMLRSTNSNIEPIKLPFPDYATRLDFTNELFINGHNVKMTVTPEQFAYLTAGLSLMHIEDIVKRAGYDEESIDTDYVWAEKKKILENLSGGLIKIIKPKWDFTVIGGLDNAKAYLKKMAGAVKKGDKLRVPMGVLLVGPPGTGKSVLAEAFANEIGFAFVILKNLRDPYVGMSERRQSLVYELLEALAPVIVYEDEVDGKNQARGSFYSGDSGVTERMNASRREFMANTDHKGEIIWIGATNRPDLMDDADLREGRYDVKLPILAPKDPKIKAEIFQAIFRKMAATAKDCQNVDFKVSVTDDELVKLIEKSETLGCSTGAEIEVIANRSYDVCKENGEEIITVKHVKEAADDFISSKDQAHYDEMTRLSLKISNWNSLIPDEYLEDAKKVRACKAS